MTKQNFEKAHTEKHDCPNCKAKKSLKLRFGSLDGGTGEQGLRVDKCISCGKKPTRKQLSKVIGIELVKPR